MRPNTFSSGIRGQVGAAKNFLNSGRMSNFPPSPLELSPHHLFSLPSFSQIGFFPHFRIGRLIDREEPEGAEDPNDRRDERNKSGGGQKCLQEKEVCTTVKTARSH